MKKVFSLDATISWVKRYVGTIIYGIKSPQIKNLPAPGVIFFAKAIKNSSAVFNLRINHTTSNTNTNTQGTICMAVTIGDTLDNSAISILSTSSTKFYNDSSVCLATKVDGVESSFIFIGFLFSSGQFDINLQAISSEPERLVSVNLFVSFPSTQLSNDNSKFYRVSKGFFAGKYPVIENTERLNAFRSWDRYYQYEAGDPVFYNGRVYFAKFSNMGDEPSYNGSYNWELLARADVSFDDITKGAKTPQLFYAPGLIISNSTASQLRRARQDQGRAYPSVSSKVYHFDDDLFDQDGVEGGNELTIDVADSSLENYVAPNFIHEDSLPRPPFTMDLRVKEKPFKETAKAYFGSFAVLLEMPSGASQNIVDYWFKLAEGGGSFLRIEFSAQEIVDFSLDYEEPFWNDNSGEVSNIFPFNADVEIFGALVFNERAESGELNVIQDAVGEGCVTPLNVQYLSQPNVWIHLAVKLGNSSIILFMNNNYYELPRLSRNLLGTTKIIINPQKKPFIIDELLTDWTASINFNRFSYITGKPLPWAAHEWDDGWMTLYINDPNKFASNLPLYLYPVGSTINQPAVNGVYDPSQTPWAKFSCFTEDQFESLGELVLSGSGQKIKVWKRKF